MDFSVQVSNFILQPAVILISSVYRKLFLRIDISLRLS